MPILQCVLRKIDYFMSNYGEFLSLLEKNGKEIEKCSKFASRKRTLLLNRHKSRGGEKHPQPFVRREDCKSYFSAYYDILSKHNQMGHCLDCAVLGVLLSALHKMTRAFIH